METIQAYKIVYKRPGSSFHDLSPSKVLVCKSYNLDTYGILCISGLMERIKDPEGSGYLNQYQDTKDAPELMIIHTDYTLEKININIGEI